MYSAFSLCFNFHFPNNQWCWESFQVLGHSHIFFCGLSLQIFANFSVGLFPSLLLSLMKVSYITDKSFCQICFINIKHIIILYQICSIYIKHYIKPFSPKRACLFFVMVFFNKQTALMFYVQFVSFFFYGSSFFFLP